MDRPIWQLHKAIKSLLEKDTRLKTASLLLIDPGTMARIDIKFRREYRVKQAFETKDNFLSEMVQRALKIDEISIQKSIYK